jgi:L1 cell adhesion molecule like protein
MSVVIPRNTSVPVKKTQRYSTAKDNHIKVTINVYEGERAKAKDNNHLGRFILSCLPGAPRGQPLDFCFSIDENGILTVSAKEISTGNTNKITITNDKGRLSTFEIKKMIEEAEKYHVEDMKILKMSKVMNALDFSVYNMKNALKKQVVNLILSPGDIKKINDAIDVAMNFLDENNHQKEIHVLEDHLKKLESMLKDLLAKTG